MILKKTPVKSRMYANICCMSSRTRSNEVCFSKIRMKKEDIKDQSLDKYVMQNHE